MDKLQKISPSTSVANHTFSCTPKRTLVPGRPGTPLHIINEENDASNEKKCTPKVPRNPFDVNSEALYFPACSPSVFATFQKNKIDNGSFRWSIEHLSVLYPADIDETHIPDTWVDAEQEMKAQKAIDTFFSQNSIVPSPWSSSPKEDRNTIKSRRKTRMSVMLRDVQSCDATTQTALSIPPGIDLAQILEKYFTFNEDEDNSFKENPREEADLSTSSLRRKLFVTEEDGKSPHLHRFENKLFYSAKRWNSPSVHMRSVHSTPASDILSSSPITPPNCSDSCNMLSSPPVSPIKKADNSQEGVQTETNINQQKTEAEFCKSSNNHIFSNSVMHGPDSFMSFCTESQEANPFPSYGSEKLDTGYVTGSINSFQNTTSSVNYGFVSRITPVMELMEECELSNSACDMSYKNDYKSMGDNSVHCQKSNLPDSHNFKTYPWMPNCCSTPAQCTHSQQMTK
ncbi:protein aurora borealis [Trichonephila inaurata madagascariensis]|uniref:Protein aurora borealis n=1 Tax=Trichonephila inaurata madagascariensis TaxID=2747483 RepID=A0A8X6M5S2_9ARAC|nr:protein aurora borealis [Trichonephila inaurata madagascariensis]